MRGSTLNGNLLGVMNIWKGALNRFIIEFEGRLTEYV